MAYVIIAVCFGLAGGIVGKLKGSSFLLWFLISGARARSSACWPRSPTASSATSCAASCPQLRTRDEDLRRPLHPLRDRARVPRGRDRARNPGSARRPRPRTERAAAASAPYPVSAALSRSLAYAVLRMSTQAKTAAAAAGLADRALDPPRRLRGRARLRAARGAARARGHDRRHRLLARADLRRGDLLELAHRAASSGFSTALGAGVSMGWSEALSDTGEQTGPRLGGRARRRSPAG